MTPAQFAIIHESEPGTAPHKGRDFGVGDADADAQPGGVTMAIRKDLLDIHYGRLPDRHGWLTRLVWSEFVTPLKAVATFTANTGEKAV